MTSLGKLLVVTVVIRFGLTLGLGDQMEPVVKLLVIGAIIGLGAFYVLRKAADIVEETTGYWLVRRSQLRDNCSGNHFWVEYL